MKRVLTLTADITSQHYCIKWLLMDVTFSMMTSSNGNISALLALCAGNSSVTGEFPSQRPVTRNFDVFIPLCLNKQSLGWWFETPSCSLWRHCNRICPGAHWQPPSRRVYEDVCLTSRCQRQAQLITPRCPWYPCLAPKSIYEVCHKGVNSFISICVKHLFRLTTKNHYRFLSLCVVNPRLTQQWCR